MMSAESWRSIGLFAALAVGAFGLWFGVAVPVSQLHAEEAAALAETQEKTARLVRSLDKLRREQRAVSSNAEFVGTWQAVSPGEATAKVQARLSDLARRSGISLRSITPLQTKEIPLKQALSFRIEAEATLSDLLAFLREAEYSSPALIIEKGNIRRLSKPGPVPKQPVVFFQFDVLAVYDVAEEDD